MTPLQISTLIETVALANIPNSKFLRATDEQANIEADNIDLAGFIWVVYNNRPEITSTTEDLNGLVIETWPIEIRLLKLAEFTEDDVNTDVLIDPLVEYARVLFGKITSDPSMSNLEFPDGYNIQLGDDTVQVYDKVMSGVILSFDIIFQTGIRC